MESDTKFEKETPDSENILLMREISNLLSFLAEDQRDLPPKIMTIISKFCLKLRETLDKNKNDIEEFKIRILPKIILEFQKFLAELREKRTNCDLKKLRNAVKFLKAISKSQLFYSETQNEFLEIYNLINPSGYQKVKKLIDEIQENKIKLKIYLESFKKQFTHVLDKIK